MSPIPVGMLPDVAAGTVLATNNMVRHRNWADLLGLLVRPPG